MEKIRLLVDDLIRLTNSDQIKWEITGFQDASGLSAKGSFKGLPIEIEYLTFAITARFRFAIDSVPFRIGFWQKRRLLKALKGADKRYDKRVRLEAVKGVLDKF